MKKSRKTIKTHYIQAKNLITRQGFNFATYDLLTDSTQWADIIFIGKNKRLYNATIYTTECAWHDIVSEKAWKILNSKVTGQLFEIVELEGYKSDKHMTGPTTISDPNMEELDGKTASQFLKEKKAELALDKTITIQESFKLLKGFTYGIGLDMVTHVSSLTNENIAKYVEKFISLGETNWQGSKQYNFKYSDAIAYSTNELKI